MVVSSCIERLQRIAEFTVHATKDDFHIVQVGDNDSGRFLKLQPACVRIAISEARNRLRNLDCYRELPEDADYWLEDVLDHRHLVAAINGLFDRADFASFSGDEWYEGDLVRQMAGLSSGTCQSMQPPAAERVSIGSRSDWTQWKSRIRNMPFTQAYEAIGDRGGSRLTDGLRILGYPDFGLYILRSPRLFLSVRCGPVGQSGRGGHDHYDQLSAELVLDGKPHFRDPGSYVYTALPNRRKQYRSVAAHFAPRAVGEVAKETAAMFSMPDASHGECIYFAEEGFVGARRLDGRSIYRMVELRDDRILILDASDIALERLDQSANGLPFSPGYGLIAV